MKYFLITVSNKYAKSLKYSNSISFIILTKESSLFLAYSKENSILFILLSIEIKIL